MEDVEGASGSQVALVSATASETGKESKEENTERLVSPKKSLERNQICVSKKTYEECVQCDCIPYNKDGQGGVSALDRLSVQPKSKIDALREIYPFPCEALPRNFLPAWRDLPLYVKLPRVPAPPGALVFARGVVGKSLLKRNTGYTTNDPLHQLRVPYSEYLALHDKHAKEYLRRPEVIRLLINQGLVTAKGEVVCTQKEFNRFRKYLSSLNSEKLAELISNEDKRWLHERHQLFQLYRYHHMLEGLDEQRLSRAEAAEHRYSEKMEEIMCRYEEKKRADCLREMHWLQEKERETINRKLLGIEKSKINAQRRMMAKHAEAKWRNQIVMAISIRDITAAERVRTEKCLQKQAYNQFLSEWLKAKLKYQEEDGKKKAAIQKKLQSDLKTRAINRQERVERYREAIPEIINRKKMEAQRVWNLVSKFFYRWLQKVRDRKSRKPDALHQSLWDIGGVLDETLRYLRKESGYETFDDFMMTVLKLKEEIKLRLAEEEALEEQERLLKIEKDAAISKESEGKRGEEEEEEEAEEVPQVEEE